MKNLKLILIFCFLLFGTFVFSQNKRSFKIIINKSNSNSTLTKVEISKLFLKKITRWKDTNLKVEPADLVDTSPARKKFSNEILDKKVSSVKAYWQKLIFSGRKVPPPEKKSDNDVLQFVQENSGAIGYVSASTNLSNYSVKSVRVQ